MEWLEWMEWQQPSLTLHLCTYNATSPNFHTTPSSTGAVEAP